MMPRRNMQNAHIPERYLLTHKVDVELQMLRAPMMNGILGEVDGRHVVAVDDCCLVHGDLQLSEQLMKPTAFSSRIGNTAILRFRAGT